MKKTLCILFLLTASKFSSLQAQIFSVSPGTDLVIKQGTVFSADDLVLTPSADFTLSNVSLRRNPTVTHTAINTYIARVYKFSAGTNLFNGTIRINYKDGAELNSLPESSLQLNAFDGTAWQSFASATNDPVNNYVVTGSISGLQLDEMTLASILNPLPVQWRSFTATWQQQNALLQWSTFAEQNTWSFIIQTSTNSTTWNTLATVPAAGNSNTVQEYRYLHTSPAAGYNYYRVVQTDKDGKQSFSLVRKVLFEQSPWHIELLGNPVRNGKLEIKVTLAGANDALPILNLYAADGKLLFTKQASQGTQSINVSGYPKGTYVIKANEKTLQFVIQ
jgi:hypothetical protein